MFHNESRKSLILPFKHYEFACNLYDTFATKPTANKCKKCLRISDFPPLFVLTEQFQPVHSLIESVMLKFTHTKKG